MREDLRIGVDVWSADRRWLGRVMRLVVSQGLERIDALIVERPGPPPEGVLHPRGAGTHGVIVPIDAVANVEGDNVFLKLSQEEFERLPPYEAHHFVQPGETWTPPPGYLREQFLVRLGAMIGGGPVVPPQEIERRKAPTEREIALGTGVWRVDGGVHERLGEVARVLFDEPTGRIEAIVLRRGFLSPEEVILPLRYVVEVRDDAVHVRITNEELARLDRFRD